MYEYSAKVTRVIDGDTIDVTVDLGFHVQIRERLRLYGINAPEVRGVDRPAGLAATAWLKEYLTELDNEITIRTIRDRKGKYGRYLAILVDNRDPQNSVDINQLMIKVGHAAEYPER